MVLSAPCSFCSVDNNLAIQDVLYTFLHHCCGKLLLFGIGNATLVEWVLLLGDVLQKSKYVYHCIVVEGNVVAVVTTTWVNLCKTTSWVLQVLQKCKCFVKTVQKQFLLCFVGGKAVCLGNQAHFGVGTVVIDCAKNCAVNNPTFGLFAFGAVPSAGDVERIVLVPTAVIQLPTNCIGCLFDDGFLFGGVVVRCGKVIGNKDTKNTFLYCEGYFGLAIDKFCRVTNNCESLVKVVV